ncbi:hypothetical protein O6H91_10G087400 [Diphasiastrum complanatum]|uniref:Uncharacterized protein n=1 Tax=Diphasiastrum complanatum TaxID=34168 RepID=A0ACC2CJ76_DIPCM|nr:hypothetical protein O6H91_Y042700 [Diphasiastrum complanatum]KAJ7542053.1 hypothetical protein O6H91_10G087400 [Diphasiastrum complanatum]
MSETQDRQAQKKQLHERQWLMARYHSPLVKQDLARLENAATRRGAMHSLKSIIKQLDAASLPRFLDQLADIPESSPARPFAISLYEEIAHDQGHCLTPHIPRCIATILRLLSASGSSAHLQSACTKAISAIATHCINPTSNSFEEIVKELCDPLMKVLSGKLEPLTTGAATCLRAVVEADIWQLMPRNICDELCLRVTIAVGERPTQTIGHLHLARSLVKHSTSAIAGYVQALLSSCRDILQQASAATERWQQRAAAAQLVAAILQGLDMETLAAELPAIAKALESSRHDRMPGVRIAVTEALQVARSLLPEVYGHASVSAGGAKTKVLFSVEVELPKSTSQGIRLWKQEDLSFTRRKPSDPHHPKAIPSSPRHGSSSSSSASSRYSPAAYTPISRFQQFPSLPLQQVASPKVPLPRQEPLPTSRKPVDHQLLVSKSMKSKKKSSAKASDDGVSQSGESRCSSTKSTRQVLHSQATQLPDLLLANEHGKDSDDRASLSCSTWEAEIYGGVDILKACSDLVPPDSENWVHSLQLKSKELTQKKTEREERPNILRSNAYENVLSNWLNAHGTGVEGEDDGVVDCGEKVDPKADDSFARITERIQSWKIVPSEEFLSQESCKRHVDDSGASKADRVEFFPNDVPVSTHLENGMHASPQDKLGTDEKASRIAKGYAIVKNRNEEYNMADPIWQDHPLQRNSHPRGSNQEFKVGATKNVVESVIGSNSQYNGPAQLEENASMPHTPKFLIRAEDLLPHLSPRSLQRLLQIDNNGLKEATECKHCEGSEMSDVDLDASSETGWSVRDNPIAEDIDKEYLDVIEGCTNHKFSELDLCKFSSGRTVLSTSVKDESASLKIEHHNENQGEKIEISIKDVLTSRSFLSARLKPCREVLESYNDLKGLKSFSMESPQSTSLVENCGFHCITRQATNVHSCLPGEDNQGLLKRFLEVLEWIEENDTSVKEDRKPPQNEKFHQNLLISVYKWCWKNIQGGGQVFFGGSFCIAIILPIFVAIAKYLPVQDIYSCPVPT